MMQALQAVFVINDQHPDIMRTIQSAGDYDSVPGATCNRTALLLDVVPLLPHILRVQLRSANVQLCSESERKALKACAGAMCDYGLQYVQRRTPEG
ncbi:Chromosome transmission fidelity protein, partial [Operophtera brumata]